MELKKRIFHILGLIAVFISLILFKNFGTIEDATWSKLWLLLVLIACASLGFAFLFVKKSYPLHIARIFSGILFVFSGFVKAVDPLGSKYKFIDYFHAWGLDFLDPTALTFGLILSTIEVVVGLMLLWNLFPRISSLLALLFMIGFTPITLYLAIQENITGAELVSDCGCFGDALVLTNWQTFVKNIFILIPVIITFIYRKHFTDVTTRAKAIKIIAIFTFATVGLSAYALRYLPPIDFRPYKIGNKLVNEDCTEGFASTYDKVLYAEFIHMQTGERKEFDISNDYPDYTIWEYNAEKTPREVNVPNVAAIAKKDSIFANTPIVEMSTMFFSKNSQDYTCPIISDTNYVFLFVAYDINLTATHAMSTINELYDFAQENSYAFYGATASLDEDVAAFCEKTHAEFPFVGADDIALKTIVRANPGLVLLKNGVVCNKWHHNTVPTVEEFKQIYK